MVNVNRRPIDISDLDTISTFRKKVASEFNTLPIYLYFPDGLPDNFAEQKDIRVVDLLDLIKENASASTDFISFLDSIKPKLQKNINIKKYVVDVWIASNTNIRNLSETQKRELVQSLKEYFPTELNFTNFLNKTQDVRDNLQKEIDRNSEMVELETNINRDIIGIPALDSTEIDIISVKIDMELNLQDTSLLELFNYVVTSRGVPFCSCQEYYKILKDFIPHDSWITNEETLNLKVSNLEVVSSDITTYKDVKVRDHNNTLIANITVEKSNKTIDKPTFVNRFLSSFNVGVTIAKETQIEMKTIFYYPNLHTNMFVLSELIMNDPSFSYLLTSNESGKATKRRTQDGPPQLYLYFRHPSVGTIKVRVSSMVVESNSKLISRGFRIGSYYTRISAKGLNIDAITKFKNIFSKLLALYIEKQDDIINIYKLYLNSSDFKKYFQKEKKVEIKNTSKLNNVDPNLFIANYSRQCTKKRNPTMVPKQDLKKYEGKLEVMKFPRDSRDGRPVPYPSDGINQQYYVCLDEKYKYPGLQVNKLDNKNEYPYVPCCFATSQKKSSNWNVYYNDKVPKDVDKVQQDLIKTNKFLKNNKFGELSADMIKLFSFIDPDPNYTYLRVGMDRGYSSFIECILLASDKIHGNQDERKNILDTYRRSITPEKASLARQSAYDMDSKTLVENIHNVEKYFDPSIYCQMMEVLQDYNIYLFNPTTMFLPRHLQIYYTGDRQDKECIFIYEHWGSESDHAKYPQCELIVRWEKNNRESTEYKFDFDDDISQQIERIYNVLRQSYTPYTPIEFSEYTFRLPPVSQVIDTYGKCRQLNYELKKLSFTIFTSPIPPLQIMEITQGPIHRVTVKIAVTLLTKYGDKNSLSQVVVDGVLKEICGRIGNTNVSIPVKDSQPLDLPVTTRVSYPDNKQSILDIYNKNKKMARYITEYCYWVFSNFFVTQNTNEITDEIIDRFATTKIIVDEKVEYNNIRKTFSPDSGMTRNGNLVVQSQEMLKRLIYCLKLFSIRNTRGLVNYHTKKVIQHYYQDITDFTVLPSQIILHGENAVDKWIQEGKGISYKFYNKITFGMTPYFFKNKLIGDELFLAQNINNMDKALDIAVTWIRKGYNRSVYAKKKKDYGFILYRYINENNIKMYNVRGSKDTESPIRILGYKIKDTIFFTVLLSL